MKKLLFALLTLIGGIPALAQPQVLDPSFAQNGVLYKSGGSVNSIFCNLNNQIIIDGGYIENVTPIYFSSFQNDGTYYNMFGNNGTLSDNDTFYTTGSKGIMKNYHLYIPKSSPNASWLVVKYDTLGSMQQVFKGQAFSLLDGSRYIQFLDAFTVDSQERLLVSQSTSTNEGHGTKVLRFKSNGDYDSTFGMNGVSTIVTENNGSDVMGIYVFSDGRILAGESGGGGAGTWMSVRFMPNGGPDHSYGDSGKVILPLPGYYMRGTIVQPDKKVLQWGDNDSLMVIRLKEDGSFDSNFGTNGKMRYQQAKMRTMLLMNDGRIVLGGDTEDSMFAIYRLMPNGSLDTTFGVGGMVRIKLRPGGEHRMNDLAIQSDGKLLAGGYTSNGLEYPARMFYFTLARFMPNGRLDVSFVAPVSKSAGLLLYPNPAEGVIWLQKKTTSAGKVQLEIVDVAGRVVLTQAFAQMNTEPVQINVENLIPGMYQAVLKEAGGKTWSEAFVKQ